MLSSISHPISYRLVRRWITMTIINMHISHTNKSLRNSMIHKIMMMVIVIIIVLVVGRKRKIRNIINMIQMYRSILDTSIYFFCKYYYIILAYLCFSADTHTTYLSLCMWMLVWYFIHIPMKSLANKTA